MHYMARSSGDSRKKPQNLKLVLPMVWDLVRPRRALLSLGFGLMIINRVSGLVLPYSTKFLIDSVIVKRHVEMLKPLVLVVLGATIIQGITSFSLTQLLSKAAQRLIADCASACRPTSGGCPSPSMTAPRPALWSRES
jgi:subfamily B ATP-binding cassette protein MsbA